MFWLIFFVIGVGAGVAVGVMAHLMARRKALRQAQQEAEEILQAAQESATQKETEGKARAEEFSRQAQKRFEREMKRKVQKNSSTQEKIKEREKRFQQQMSQRQDILSKRQSLLTNYQNRVQSQEESFRSVEQKRDKLLAQYIEKLSQVSGLSREQAKQNLLQQIDQETRTRVTRQVQFEEEEAVQDTEKNAKRLVNIALHRFARAYCPERGIGNVTFPNPDVMKRTLGPDQAHLKTLEKLVGVDITYSQENLTASVLGFDPVRRELGRACLERMVHEKNLHENRIAEMVKRSKKELYKRIRRDGNRVASELKIEGLHQEVRDMMGALRYRYSFAQNQHFHCAEVGWLCGLLASEIGVNILDARRSGLLHDIGKAMDHSIDGGHAVIGADFIQKHGEQAHIVHAVRAHHHDETPSTDLAYLVIAADAISGARPGARRSTMDSYNQKMADLEKIGNSFKGVTNTYILSAGREVRVTVDSHRVDDHNALVLSKKIAQKIEEECSYPGLIKVTVVRETQAVQMAK